MKKQEKKKKALLIIGIIILIIIAVLLILAARSKTVDYNGGNVKTSIVEINGEKYEEKPNTVKYLLYGVDDYAGQEGEVPGCCDVIMLLVINRQENTFGLININRDTEADVFSYDKDGKVIASVKAQIAYANIHGEDDATRAKSVKASVSSLFYGVNIDRYIGLEMDSIKIINNLAGGVTVNITEDLTSVDPAFKKGSRVTLTDEQAERFVRARMNVGDGMNSSRMERQEEFLKGVSESFKKQYKEDSGFASRVFDELRPCMNTDATGQDFSRIGKAILKGEDLGSFKIKGEYSVDEFNVRLLKPYDSSLAEIATTLLYRKAK